MQDLNTKAAQAPVDTSSRFPALTSKDLAGHPVALPEGLPGERTLVLVAFVREQQTDIDGWVAGLNLGAGNIPWLELPVIDNPGAIGRWFIDNGMRRGIENHDTWKHVVTLYTQKAKFKASLGITTEATIYAMVVDRHGKVLARVAGPYTAQAAEAIKAALQ